MFHATYKEGFATKFGHTVTVENQKGEWRLFGQGLRPPDFQAGDQVEFQAESKPSRDGKKYWHYTSMSLKGSGGDSPRSSGRHTAATDAFRQMYIVGIVGRAMGSGKFDAADIESLTLSAAQAFDTFINRPTSSDVSEEMPYDR